jgi:hypothetical protein
LKQKPLGFTDETGFYTDPSTPPYFSWASSQTWATNLVALLNSAVASALVFLSVQDSARAAVSAFAFILCGGVQILTAVKFLRSREGKISSDAVFGVQPKQKKK